jgi:hypothetical protein
METVLPLLLIIAMVATAAVLAVGIVTFAFSAKLNARYAGKLMTARVVLQFAAVAILAAIVLLKISAPSL